VLALGLERRRTAAGKTLLATTIALFFGVVLVPFWPRDDEPALEIGAKTFTEQYILADLLAVQIERRTGLRSTVRSSLGSTVVFDALRHGDIDAYVDYSGTLWATVLKKEPPTDREEALGALTIALAQEYHVTLVAALGFENTYALAMKADQAESLGVRSIQDLAPHAATLSIGGDYEFFSRAEWLAVRDRYGLGFQTQRTMDPSLLYAAVAQGDVDVVSAYSTDGRIAAYHLTTLADDRHVIPPSLRALDGTLDATTMQALNRAVDDQKQDPLAVARQALAQIP
jgi:osmoprotectant transport system permease protein